MDQIKEIERYKKQLSIAQEKYEIFSKWIYIQNMKKSILDGLREKKIRQIIIYGATELAVRLIEYCEEQKYKVAGITDRRIRHANSEYRGIPLVTIEELQSMDLSSTSIVITAIGHYEEIKEELIKKNIENVITIRELMESAL